MTKVTMTHDIDSLSVLVTPNGQLCRSLLVSLLSVSLGKLLNSLVVRQMRHLNSLTPEAAIWCHGTWSTMVQVMACCVVAPSHYLKSWTNVDLSWMRSGGIPLRPISQEMFNILTHWGWVMHKCISNITIIGSDNGLLPGQRQAIIWANVGTGP